METSNNLQRANSESSLTRAQAAISPAVDIFESEGDLVLFADMPGVTKDDLKIQIDKSQLTIEAARSSDAKASPLLAEYRPTGYRRVFAIPRGIDVDRISAKLEQGVLHLTLPKGAALKPRVIEVR